MSRLITIALSIFLTTWAPKAESVGSTAALTEAANAIYGARTSISELNIKIVNGDVASGVVLKRDKGFIAVDITPCKLEDKKVKAFWAPFAEKNISDVKCGDKSYPRVQVIQESGI